MYYSKTDILKRLQEHNNYVSKQVNGNIIGTFLYGSQNYYLNTPESDIDSISIYIPTQEEIYFSKDWLSKEYEMANREHAVIKDIRVLMRDWLNGSMTNLEVLFTHFYVIESDRMILDIFESIKKIVQVYLISNKEKMAKAIYGQILGTAKVKYLTPKKIKNIIRLYYALSIYQLADNKSINHIFELDIIYIKEKRNRKIRFELSLPSHKSGRLCASAYIIQLIMTPSYTHQSEETPDTDSLRQKCPASSDRSRSPHLSESDAPD